MINNNRYPNSDRILESQHRASLFNDKKDKRKKEKDTETRPTI